MVLASSDLTHTHPVRLSSIAGLLDRNVSRICIANHSRSVSGSRPRVLPHWVNSSLTDGHAYVTYGSTIWELVGTRIQYKFEILVVFLVGMDII